MSGILNSSSVWSSWNSLSVHRRPKEREHILFGGVNGIGKHLRAFPRVLRHGFESFLACNAGLAKGCRYADVPDQGADAIYRNLRGGLVAGIDPVRLGGILKKGGDLSVISADSLEVEPHNGG